MSEEFNFLEAFDALEATEPTERTEIVKAPFCWPGGKSKTLDKVLPHLPYYNSWVDVFGGSGVVTLARNRSKLEVFNDRYSGVTDFYKCIAHKDLHIALMERLELTLHSREAFYEAIETWEQTQDHVERAAKWYYSIIYSFAAKGKTFGRTVTGTNCLSGRVNSLIQDFPAIHRRFQGILIENLDFRKIIKDFDSKETVFYLDPPYMETCETAYKYEMKVSDHEELLDLISKSRGFFALSGYPNDLYKDFPWDNLHTWDQYVSINGTCKAEDRLITDVKRGSRKECLWIREAR